jgi:hypothetical protein
MPTFRIILSASVYIMSSKTNNVVVTFELYLPIHMPCLEGLPAPFWYCGIYLKKNEILSQLTVSKEIN